MKEDLIIRLAARCEAAGRPNNEDNYQISEDLAADSWGFTADKTLPLGDKGALLVVCDGMGGMNAGEVASAIAVATIKKAFAKEFITDKVLASSAAIQHFISDAIQAADAAIKEEGRLNPEHEGMGSTIALAWLLGNKVYVGWCGDSRVYRFNPVNGLERLSHDHSYVQELVDAGKLTEELAFDHPNNNIITRSLGDPRGKARPDTKEYELYNGDVLMLCSDGLCGCLRDNEIEAIMAKQSESMQACRDALWEADEAAGWHDNVTIALAQVVSGAAVMTEKKQEQPVVQSFNQKYVGGGLDGNVAVSRRAKRNMKITITGIAIILLLGCAFVGYNVWKHKYQPQEPVIPADSTIVASPDTIAPEPVATEKAGPAAKPAAKEAPAAGPAVKTATAGEEPAQPAHKEDPDVQVKTVPVENPAPAAPTAPAAPEAPEAPATPATPAAPTAPAAAEAPAVPAAPASPSPTSTDGIPEVK